MVKQSEDEAILTKPRLRSVNSQDPEMRKAIAQQLIWAHGSTLERLKILRRVALERSNPS